MTLELITSREKRWQGIGRPWKAIWHAVLNENFTASADTKPAAVAALHERVKVALQGSYAPIVVVSRFGHAIVATRSPNGWMWQHYDAWGGDHGCCYLDDDRVKIESAMRRHLAQYLDGEGFDGIEVLKTETDIADHRRYRAWQQAYKDAPAYITGTARHQWASEHLEEHIAQ